MSFRAAALAMIAGGLAQLGCTTDTATGPPPDVAPRAEAASGSPTNSNPARRKTAGPAAASQEQESASPTGGPHRRRFALLVGCTRYDNLPMSSHLRGPANDVQLMKRLLKDHFDFQDADIIMLAESTSPDGQPTGANGRPTFENIQQQFQDLAGKVGPGDQVMILLAGHGTQQPNNDPENPADPEFVDGCDEVFLPANIANWDATPRRIPGGITDDQLHEWLVDIGRKGAIVWLMVDACHSGTMMRGAINVDDKDRIAARMIDPKDLGIKDDELQRAKESAPRPTSATRGARPIDELGLSENDGAIGALYAALSHEPTLERPLPPEGNDKKTYGMLTFATFQVLSDTKAPLTYRELVQAIHYQFLRWGLMHSTPLAESADLDRRVLGRESWRRSRILLSRDTANDLSLNAGALHGLTVGSILDVRPTSDQADADRLLGHVQVKQVRPQSADVLPIAFADVDAPALSDLPERARCEVVYEDFGNFKLPLAIDAPPAAESPDDDGWLPRVKNAVETLRQETKKGAFIRLVLPADARWLLQRHGSDVYLVPASGFTARTTGSSTNGASNNATAAPPLYGPVPLDDKFPEWLSERVRRIARVENLLALAASAERDRLSARNQLNVQVDMLLLPNSEAQDGKPVAGDSVRQLNDGDIIGVRVTNASDDAVDVTLLFVDSDYMIEAAFPYFVGAGENRLPAGKSAILYRGQATPSNGQEHFVLIAVPAGRAPVDFTSLAQPSLAAARGVRGAPAALDTRWGQLLESAMFGAGTMRGETKVESSRHAMRLISCEVSGH